MAVCPAGEEVIAPFLLDRKRFTEETLRPLQKKKEPVYVVARSDAEQHVRKRFPHKSIRHVHGRNGGGSIAGFLFALPHVFQSNQSAGLAATYHFVFTGSEQRRATVIIRDRRITVTLELHGDADLVLTADSQTWLGYLARKRNLLWAMLTGRIRVGGPIRLLRAFGRCFPA